jgi:hypothetical protein
MDEWATLSVAAMKAKIVLVGMLCMLLSQVGTAGGVWVSKRGLFTVSYESALQPIEINRIHQWVLHIESESGEFVTGANIEVTGGMPAHDHGLPTRPRVIEELEDGNYRLDGMRFHMAGDWELTIIIVADGKTDTVIVALHL